MGELSSTLVHRLGLAVSVVLVLTVGVGVSGAKAEPTDSGPKFGNSTTEAQPDDANPACWTGVESKLSACASDQTALAAAVYDEFGITFTNSGDPTELTAKSQAVESSRTAQSKTTTAAAATWIFGTNYHDINYKGYSRTYSTDRPNPCQQAGNYIDAYFQAYSYQVDNDSVQSVTTVAPCRIQLWADIEKGGSTTGQIPSTPDLLGMRQQASSWEYSR